MIKHFIILGSSYSEGKRIVLDYTGNDKVSEEFLSDLNKIGEKYSIATHAITAESSNWKDVQKADPFFNDVKLVKTKQEFIDYLSKDDEVSTMDVANYVLSRLDTCTHLRLEKLLYFCYADYLCKYNKKLFDDTIYAFKYGPVIDSIYEIFKGSSGEIRGEKPSPQNVDIINKNYRLSLESRILNSVDGLNKITSIENTLDKYKRFNTNTLIALTYRDNSPWSHSDKGESMYRKITDEDIIKYHQYEEA